MKQRRVNSQSIDFKHPRMVQMVKWYKSQSRRFQQLFLGGVQLPLLLLQRGFFFHKYVSGDHNELRRCLGFSYNINHQNC